MFCHAIVHAMFGYAYLSMPVGSSHKAGELELASIWMLKNVNKLQNVDGQTSHVMDTFCQHPSA